jgi:hypothetical protein
LAVGADQVPKAAVIEGLLLILLLGLVHVGRPILATVLLEVALIAGTFLPTLLFEITHPAAPLFSI